MFINLEVDLPVAMGVSRAHHRRGKITDHWEGDGDRRALKYSICLKIT